MRYAALFILATMLYCGSPAHAVEQATEKTLNYVIAIDQSSLIDRVLYHAFNRVGYKITMHAAPMNYAIQMADSGEKDGLGLQSSDLSGRYPHLVKIPEPVSDVNFQLLLHKDSRLKISSWGDLAGLRVGSLFQKTSITKCLPQDIAAHVQKVSPHDLLNSLLTKELDAAVVTNISFRELSLPENVRLAATLETRQAYAYLNKKHEKLVPAVSESLKAMKEDGTYEKIMRGELKKNDSKVVLHISSYYPEDIWDSGIKSRLETIFTARGNTIYYNVPLYSNRFHSDYERALNAYSTIRTMFISAPPDVIIASDNNALTFVCDYYDIFFSRVPVVFCGISGEFEKLWKLKNNYSGVWESVSAKQTMEMILKIFPDTRNVFVLNDHFSTGTSYRKETQQQLGSYESKLNIYYNEDVPIARLMEEIKQLQPGTIVLLGNYAMDSENIHLPRAELQRLICRQSPVPVFSLTNVGQGQVGGRVIDPELQAAAVARQALEVLDGKHISKIESVRDAQKLNTWIFDASVLSKFAIDKELLPEGAKLINIKPSLYEANPQAFVLLVMLLVLAAAIIGALLFFMAIISRKNRRLLEARRSLHSAEEMLMARERLGIALEASKSGVWELSVRDGIFSFDSRFAELYQLEAASPVSFGVFLACLKKSCREKETYFDQFLDGCPTGAKPDGEIRRISLADGSERYVSNSLKIMLDKEGKPERAIGLAFDVTEQVRISQENLEVLTNLLDGMESMVYVTDLETDELLFVNKKLSQLCGLEGKGVGSACWAMFKPERSSRCEFCPKNRLKENPDEIVTWEEYDARLEKYFRHTDKIVKWPGNRRVHVQEIVDITELKTAELAIQKRLKQQELAAKVSYKFISAGESEALAKDALRLIGEFLGCDRMLLGLVEPGRMRVWQEWMSGRAGSRNKPGDSFPFGPGNAFYESLIVRGMPFFKAENPILNRNAGPRDLGVQSSLAAPLIVDGQVKGMLLFDQIRAPRRWTENEVQLAILISNIFAGIYVRDNIQRSLKKISALVRNNPQFVALVDSELRLELLNPASFAMSGYTAEEIRKGGIELLHDSKTISYIYDEMFPKALDVGEAEADLPLIRKDGEVRILSFSMFPIIDKKEAWLGAVASDVTEQRKLASELIEAKNMAESANKAKSGFLSNMSHEIRTPMTALKGLLEIARKSDELGQIKACLRKMEISSNHLMNILNDVLDMAKIESGRLELSSEEFDLDETMTDLMSVIGVKAAEKEQEITLRISRAIPKKLRGDSMRLNQINMNLLSNAIKFSGQGKSIHVDISLARRDDKFALLKFSVADQGIGISPEQQATLFKPFQQADSSITKRFGGTGLGLAISKVLTEMMGGEFWLEAEEGKGSTFTFTARFELMPDQPKVEFPPLSGIVLIVDGNPVTCGHIGEILDAHSVRHERAGSGQEALEAVNRLESMGETVEVLLIDNRLPDIDGITAVRQIRKKAAVSPTAILMAMGEMLQFSSQAREAGASGFFLQKPIIETALAQALKGALTEHPGSEEYKEKSGAIPVYPGKHVLIVEDADINREIIRYILEPTQVEISEAENGLEALEMFKKEPGKFDLILMDIQMPVMDGYSASMAIRESSCAEGATIPIIAITANAFSYEVENALNAKMDAHLSKPIDSAEVYKKLEEYLGGGR